jgi:hypothetical protein
VVGHALRLAFLALAAAGSLPDGFAVPAGSGDVAVGLAAPLVALSLIGRGRLGQRIYLAWTAFGAFDLVAFVLHLISWGQRHRRFRRRLKGS